MVKTTLAVMIAKRRLGRDKVSPTTTRKKSRTSPLMPWLGPPAPASEIPESNSTKDDAVGAVSPTEVDHLLHCVQHILQEQQIGSVRTGRVEHLFKKFTSLCSQQWEACEEFMLANFLKHPRRSSQLLFRLFCCGNDTRLEEWIRSLILSIWPLQVPLAVAKCSRSSNCTSSLAPDEAVYFLPVLRQFESTGRGEKQDSEQQENRRISGQDEVQDPCSESLFEQYLHLLQQGHENATGSEFAYCAQLLWLNTYQSLNN